MPSWASIYKKHQADGFEIVGFECQGSSVADINTIVKSKGADFDICEGGEIKGAVVGGIPHTFLFGADGNLISESLRAGPELEKKVTEALKECGAALAGAGPYTKLNPLALQIKTGLGLGTVLKTLATKKTSKDSVEAAEATMMYEALHSGALSQIDRSVEMKMDDPLSAVVRLDNVAKQFTGDEIGKKAAEQAALMRKDPAVRKEAEGEVMWKVIVSLNEKLKPVRGSRDPNDEAFKKANIPAIQSLILGCGTIIQRVPGTKAAERAKTLIEDYK